MTYETAIRTLTERQEYLKRRIFAKASMPITPWDTTYDQREHDALEWALERLPMWGE